MVVIDHGKWEIYTPDKGHPNAPPKTMYARRVSDGADWYPFVHANNKFKKGSVIATVLPAPMGLTIGAAVYEADRLFPGGGYLIEIQGYTGDNPQRDFGCHFYDPETNTISEDTEVERIQARGKAAQDS